MLKNENKIFLLPLSQYSQVVNSLISPRIYVYISVYKYTYRPMYTVRMCIY